MTCTGLNVTDRFNHHEMLSLPWAVFGTMDSLNIIEAVVMW